MPIPRTPSASKASNEISKPNTVPNEINQKSVESKENKKFENEMNDSTTNDLITIESNKVTESTVTKIIDSSSVNETNDEEVPVEIKTEIDSDVVSNGDNHSLENARFNGSENNEMTGM